MDSRLWPFHGALKQLSLSHFPQILKNKNKSTGRNLVSGENGTERNKIFHFFSQELDGKNGGNKYLWKQHLYSCSVDPKHECSSYLHMTQRKKQSKQRTWFLKLNKKETPRHEIIILVSRKLFPLGLTTKTLQQTEKKTSFF